MPKFTIELDSETHKMLKQKATEDERSLTQYMQRVLRQHAGTLIVNTITSVEEQSIKNRKSVIGGEEEDPYAEWR